MTYTPSNFGQKDTLSEKQQEMMAAIAEQQSQLVSEPAAAETPATFETKGAVEAQPQAEQPQHSQAQAASEIVAQMPASTGVASGAGATETASTPSVAIQPDVVKSIFEAASQNNIRAIEEQLSQTQAAEKAA